MLFVYSTLLNAAEAWALNKKMGNKTEHDECLYIKEWGVLYGQKRKQTINIRSIKTDNH